MIRYKNAHMNQLVRIIPGKYPRVDNSENISITERCTAVLVETVGGKDGVGCWHALVGDKLILIWADQFQNIIDDAV